MALNIRLSPALDLLARNYCERVGISLNSLVGVALDAYLRQPELARAVVGVDALPAPGAAPALVPRPAAERVERVEQVKPVLTAAPFGLPGTALDPRPVLGAKPSKADRSKLAAWHKRNS